jgi:hypothetical protein
MSTSTLMNLILILAVFLSGAVIGVIALVVVGIHSDESARNLTNRPRTRADAGTRRLLGVGVRKAGPDSQEEVNE